MNENKLLEEININIKRLLGAVATQGNGTHEKIITLKSMGFNSVEIKAITGIPEGTTRTLWNKKPKRGWNGKERKGLVNWN